MTPDQFRRLAALSLPEAVESEHMGHPDFRVGAAKGKGKGKGKGKIFATLDSPEPGWGMVKLTPGHQRRLMKEHPGVFVPASGAWGAAGCTHVRLGRGGVSAKVLKEAITKAWCHAAPKEMVGELGLG